MTKLSIDTDDLTGLQLASVERLLEVLKGSQSIDLIVRTGGTARDIIRENV